MNKRAEYRREAKAKAKEAKALVQAQRHQALVDGGFRPGDKKKPVAS